MIFRKAQASTSCGSKILTQQLILKITKVLEFDKSASFKSLTRKAHFHSQFHWNTSLDSVMTMTKSFTVSNINSILWGKVIMTQFSKLMQWQQVLITTPSNCRTWWWEGCFDKTVLVYATCDSKFARKTCTLQKIESKSSLLVGYRMIQCDSIPVPQMRNFTWRLSVKSALEKPRWIIVAFQTDKSGNQQHNPSIFHHCNLTNMFVVSNSRRYSEIDYDDTNFT